MEGQRDSSDMRGGSVLLNRVRNDDEHDRRNLLDRLEIRPPEDLATAPPVLAFQRKREVEIPWGGISDGVDGASNASLAAIREYLPPVLNTDPDNPSGVRQLVKGPQKPDSSIKPYGVYRTNFEALPKPAASDKLETGFVIQHGPSGRLYLLLEATDETLTPQDFETPEKYNDAWQRKIEGIELVFESAEDAATYYTQFEEIDLRPTLIQRRYEELRILLGFAKTVKDKVAKVTGDRIDRALDSTNAEELEQLQTRILRLEIGEYDVQRRIDRLVSDAGRLGYLLATKAGKAPDGKTPLEEGKLYTTSKRTACWTEVHRRFLRKARKVRRERIETVYEEIDTRKDILADTCAKKRSGGYEVYVFAQSPIGLITDDGVLLREIMDRCDIDETFRRRCVVMLPVYEESLTGTRLLTKYCGFTHPLKGLVPDILPRLALAESLSYRIAWKETQLGELVSSINLAPGEERRVTITKRLDQETTVSRTSTSIFDVSRAETSDLATEMENQARQERETSSNLQFSTTVSGGYGPISAQATASGGTKSSLKDVSQAISKVARSASQSVSQQNRQEVTVTATARTTISKTDETVATLRNINQGRSLNLMFYRLYNKYAGGLFLDDLRFDVIPSVELIAGSGVHESKSYSFEEMDDAIEEFRSARLPFTLKPEGEAEYKPLLVHAIFTMVKSEYEVTDEAVLDRETNERAPENEAAARRTPEDRAPTLLGASTRQHGAPTSVGVLKLPQLVSSGKLGLEAVQAQSNQLRGAIILSDKPMVRQDLLVAAPGLYLDSMVGAQPSTEPYAEQMRAQEVRMREAEVFVKASEGAYKQAMAMRLAQMQTGAAANYLTGILPDAALTTLTVSLRMPLMPGDWSLCFRGEIKKKVERTDLGGHLIAFSWDQPQDWLHSLDLMSQISVENVSTGERMVFLGSSLSTQDV